MKAILIVTLFLSYSSFLYSQRNFSDPTYLDSVFEPKLPGEEYTPLPGLVGSQYYNNEWVLGNLELVNGKKICNKLLKYNGFIDEALWLPNDSDATSQIKLDKLSVADFWIQNPTGKSAHFKRINTKKIYQSDSTDIFAEVITEGKFSLYIFRKISVIEDKNLVAKGKFYYTAKLGQTPIYYIKQPTGQFYSLYKIKKKYFLNLFGEQRNDINKLLKKNNQRIRTESDLVNVFFLLNKEENKLKNQ